MPAELNFNAADVPPSTPFEPIPAGTYRMHIVESEVKRTKDGAGRYLQLVWEVTDGGYKGRKVWDRLNIDNPNKTAQDIAQRGLSAICHATGQLQLRNSEQLHHKPVMVRVTVRQDAGQEPQNDVKGYKACDDNPAAVKAPRSGNTAIGGQQAGALANGQPAQAAAVPPWAQKKAG